MAKQLVEVWRPWVEERAGAKLDALSSHADDQA
ncbi:MAG: hypothetical protein AAFQ17_02310, partial [Pseudomonadota bacterium]